MRACGWFAAQMLEKLYRQGWKRYDGLGALIISPTRELVDQTFAVLNKVGRFHQFAGGVVFGGKDKKGKRKDGTKRYLKVRMATRRFGLLIVCILYIVQMQAVIFWHLMNANE